jgi:hypothetical protein
MWFANPKKSEATPAKTRAEVRADYFTYFVSNYPTQEARLARARGLVVGTQASSTDIANPTRMLLASHWGHREGPLRNLAYTLYEQKDRLSATIGQRVLVVASGSAEKALADPSMLLEDLALVQGTVPEAATPVYQFGGNPNGKGKLFRGVRPPYLNFGVELPLQDTVHIGVGLAGADITGRYDAENVRLYGGTLSVAGDQVVYGETFTADRKTVFIGDAACQGFFDALGERTYIADVAKELFAAV